MAKGDGSISAVKDKCGNVVRLKHVEALIGNMALKSITVPVLEKTFAMIKEKRNLLEEFNQKEERQDKRGISCKMSPSAPTPQNPPDTK